MPPQLKRGNLTCNPINISFTLIAMIKFTFERPHDDCMKKDLSSGQWLFWAPTGQRCGSDGGRIYPNLPQWQNLLTFNNPVYFSHFHGTSSARIQKQRPLFIPNSWWTQDCPPQDCPPVGNPEVGNPDIHLKRQQKVLPALLKTIWDLDFTTTRSYVLA